MPFFPAAALAFATVTTRLSALDLALIAVYLLGITLFGLRFRKSSAGASADRSLKSYFLANQTIPWWAIALSIVSAETSTLTIISIPGVAFAGDFGFLQIVIGYMLGRIVVAVLFLPRYFAGEMLTAYQLIDRRFGPALHKVTAGLFLLTRATAEGVRVFAVSIVIGVAIGTGNVASIAIISLLTLLYTFEGGMAAVVWTDVVQMAIYVGGTIVAVFTLGSHVSGGWPAIHSVAAAAGKFHTLDFAFSLTKSYTFWAGVLGGTFLTMASHGTDQLMVQRLLAAKNLRESRTALLSSGVVIFLQFALFLLIGAGLYVFYGQHPGSAFRTNDYIFPTFIVREMPVGVAGLLIAAILAAAMSNLSAALNSLSSTTVVDFYMGFRPQADDRERGLISKSSTVLWALVLFVIAIYSLSVGGKGHVVEIGLSIASVAYGCLLGVFLLGTLTRYATQWGAAIGMLCGFALNLWLWQGKFPVTIGPITIPHIAFTWYVLIGAAATFLIGSLASLVFRKQSTVVRTSTAALLIALLILPQANAQNAPSVTAESSAPDFSALSTLMNDAIAGHKLPGAVVIVGHSGRVVFHQAYGSRKLANEPGLDGLPSPAEPMTEDTIFDMASLTKCLATATAIMELYDQGKLQFDDPVQKYLPEFNSGNDPQRARVTLRMLLTHTSGEAPDISLKDPWGLASSDKPEGIHRALTNPLQSGPGEVFRYSDINFILLGALIEKITGDPEDVFVQRNVFEPLGMTDTRYLPPFKACGPRKIRGSAIAWAPKPPGRIGLTCPTGTWSTSLFERIAPTAHDDEMKATPNVNPDFDYLLRGVVHDPTTRRMGGVAGHAGVFSTAHDVSIYAQALLDRLAGRPSKFPVKQSTLELMTTPEQPGHDASQLTAANQAEQADIQAGAKGAEPGLAPHYPAIKGQDLRGFGWDIDTAFSKPRGMIFPIGSFGHTGFTGTTLWIDPGSDTYVVLLANAIHPRGATPISNLRGQVATAAARALDLYSSTASATNAPASGIPDPIKSNLPPREEKVRRGALKSEMRTGYRQILNEGSCLTGIDVLEATQFAALDSLAKQHNHSLHLGLLTNQSGLDTQGHRTVDILARDLPKSVPDAKLVALFSPEHGIFGKQETTAISSETDPTTGLHVTSLYGPHDSDKRPSHEQLANLDAVVIDLQDAGVHFWTYESVLGYFLEASARELREYNHRLDIVVLDRPNPIDGVDVQGPMVDPGRESYVGYMPLPTRHGLTYGELARYINGEKVLPLTAALPVAPTASSPESPTGIHATHTPPMRVDEQGEHRTDTHAPASSKGLHAPLVVVSIQDWKRSEYFEDTHLTWVNPSPNLRSPTANILYPALGLIEFNNISVGRGTDAPFSFFGAGIPAKDKKTGEQPPAWFHGAEVANYLTARRIPGVRFIATTMPIVEDANHYPFHGQTIEAVKVELVDRRQLDSPELGIEILAALHHLYPTQFNLDKAMPLVLNQATMDALRRGEDPRKIAASWIPSLDAFRAARAPYLLYQ
ncbi:MAG TPA: sodium/solute symporter [Acidobacteriaceae bacterium]